MEKRDEATTTSSSAPYTTAEGGEEPRGGGGGGKMRRPFLRKLPSTPYSRPPPPPQTPGGSRWYWKLVDPATRLISSSAAMLFPSFFSKPPSVDSPSSDDGDRSIEEVSEEVKHDDSGERPQKLPDIQISKSMEGGQVPQRGETSNSNLRIDEHEGDKLRKSSDDTGISEIEQMLEGRTFSRDDLSRLAELLQSRIVDDHEKRSQDVTSRANEESRRTSADEKLALWLPRVVDEVANSRPEATVPNPVSASPIDLAKAYMGSRTSEPGFGSHSLMLKDEGTPLPATAFSSKSSIFSPAPRSAICWPGARVQDQRAYLTPQIDRNRVGLHNLPRTPYSRPAHSRSTSKLQAGGNRPLNISSTQWKHSQTPIYGDKQVTRTRISHLEDGFGSVGPIRRIHRTYGATTPKGTSLSRHASSSPFWAERTDASKSFSPMFKEKHESGASTSSSMKVLPGTSKNSSAKFLPVDIETPSSNIGVSTVHPQSCDVARKILEHLDRSMLTPKKKSEELKVATSWRKPLSSQLPTSTLNAQFNNSLVEGPDSHCNMFGSRFSGQGKEVGETSLPKVQPEQSKIDESTDAVITSTTTSNTVSTKGDFGCSVVPNSRPFFNFNKSHDPIFNAHKVSDGFDERSQTEKNQQLHQQSQTDGQYVSRFPSSDAAPETLDVQKKPPRQSIGSKPELTSISMGKHDPTRAAALVNGFGFTFPVSASSGALSEPPTPSIMPSFGAGSSPQKEESTKTPSVSFGSKAGPSFSFGSKNIGHSPVFSFSSASPSPDNDFTNLKFTFGSEKGRVSFRICLALTVAVTCIGAKTALNPETPRNIKVW